jgi:hypothetical protein
LALGLTIIGALYLWDRKAGNDRGLLPWLGVCCVVLFLTNMVGGIVGYEVAQFDAESLTTIPGTETEVPDFAPAVAGAFLANVLLAYAALYGLAMFTASVIAAGLCVLALGRVFTTDS